MRQGALGAGSSGTHTPTYSADGGPELGTHGLWRRWVSRSPRPAMNLWRAVDQGGHSRDLLVQWRRAQAAAQKFFRTLLQGLTAVPRGILTDQLQSDSAATREVWPRVEHRQHRDLTTRAEHSPPTRPASA